MMFLVMVGGLVVWWHRGWLRMGSGPMVLRHRSRVGRGGMAGCGLVDRLVPGRGRPPARHGKIAAL